jgi:hypothetical protein
VTKPKCFFDNWYCFLSSKEEKEDTEEDEEELGAEEEDDDGDEEWTGNEVIYHIRHLILTYHSTIASGLEH